MKNRGCGLSGKGRDFRAAAGFLLRCAGEAAGGSCRLRGGQRPGQTPGPRLRLWQCRPSAQDDHSAGKCIMLKEPDLSRCVFAAAQDEGRAVVRPVPRTRIFCIRTRTEKKTLKRR
jgi:hypothetical protein